MVLDDRRREMFHLKLEYLMTELGMNLPAGFDLSLCYSLRKTILLNT